MEGLPFPEAAEALLRVSGDQEAEGRVYHREGRRELRRLNRGSQKVHEGPGLQDLIRSRSRHIHNQNSSSLKPEQIRVIIMSASKISKENVRHLGALPQKY